MDFDFPFHFDGRGRSAVAGERDHIRDMIEQLLFTSPGERVNRPDFGCGLLKMVHAPNSREVAKTLEGVVQASIQRYLGDLIELRGLEAIAEDSKLSLTLSYVVRRTNEVRVAQISRRL